MNYFLAHDSAVLKSRPGRRRLKPLALALIAAFPVCGLAQTAIVRPPAPAPTTVPKTLPGWRVSGTGAPAPTNKANAAGGIDQTIDQTSQRGIYNWQSFDIGSASSVTFSFPSIDSSALNRVLGSSAPSQIFGSLRSVYANPEAGKAPLVGGSIYLINANGILFGRNAQVNVGSLVASTLNLSDADFTSGLTGAITGSNPAFSYQGAPELFTDERNFVVVDPGATITTPNGGRVFLFAKNVQNAGTITTPGGQTVLAAGSEVFLNDPTAELLYASEVNPDFPALRGLLVEVGQGSGTAMNLAGGTINTPRGNATLVGMAVNQSGRISATTSVNENGSVMLLARGSAQATTGNGVTVKRATTAGTLTLGSGSQIEIAPDTTSGADGKTLTADGNSIFTTSRVELSGQTIDMQPGASIVAHGGIVDVRAETTPFYPSTPTSSAYDLAAFDTASPARIVVGDGVTLDVSGTTSTEVSAARNFVTTQLIGKTDLKDAPLQKDGPIYRSKLTFDIRSPVPILGDTSSYQTAIQRSVDERLAKGGTVTLMSNGSVVTNEHSLLDVSGGKVTYTDALVTPTVLIGADGARYTLATAPKDIVYTGIEGQKAPVVDRWGVVPQYVPSQASTGRMDKGYVDGQAGGTLNVIAPVSVLDGRIEAAATAGVRQTGGRDPLPAAGTIAIGVASNGPSTGQAFGGANFLSAGLRSLDLTRAGGSLGQAFWADPLGAALPDTGRIAAGTLNASGAGRIVITADGALAQETGADLSLPPGAIVSFGAAGAGGIDLGGSFHSVGGSFSARTADLGAAATVGVTRSGTITLQAGQQIDVAADWVNRSLDGTAALAATPGGSVSLSAAHGLNLQDASRINVSGAATVGAGGSVAGTAAGSITLESNVARSGVAETPAPMHVGAVLVADSLTTGGTLRLRSDTIDIGAKPILGGIRDGASPGSLVLSDQFFRQGAFTTYDIGAVALLTVEPGTVLAPQASNWILTADAHNVASGTDPASFLQTGTLPDTQRAPASLRLRAAAPFADPAGSLSVGAGASITVDPRAGIDLSAGRNLSVDGTLRAPGGAISLGLTGGSVSPPVAGTFRVGGDAVLDANATTVVKLPDGGPPQGTVLAGGTVTLALNSAATFATPIEVLPGAVISADGASATLAVNTTTAAGATELRVQTVSTPGGTINVKISDGGAVIAGDLHARAGGTGVADGSFTLSLSSTYNPGASPPVLTPEHSIVVQQAPVTDATVVPGSVLLSAQSLSDNFADVSLQSFDRIRFSGDVQLAATRNLNLDAPVISASPNSTSVVLSGDSTLVMGNSPLLDLTRNYAPIGGAGSLKLQGGLVEFRGQETFQGFGKVGVQAGSDIRLHGISSGGAQTGRLELQSDLTLTAPQVAPTSNSQFTIDAPGQRVLITGGDSGAAAPLSAGGAVTINAREISTVNAGNPASYGVLRAPLGSLTLNASERIVVGNGSVLSVSGEGLSVPFGSTIGGVDWTYAGSAVTTPLAKTIDLLAPGKSIDVGAGAKLDLSGGGDLLAYEFVPGPGGSKDVFAGAASGAFAVVPTVKGYAPQDTDLLKATDASGASASPQIGREITFGAGGPLPAGSYTVLPARYALLPGAFLVSPVASAAPLELGAGIARQDGSILVGGRLGDVGTPFANSLPQTFQVSSSALAQTRSEIRQSNANDYFTSQANSAGTTVPRLPVDAGRLDVLADQLGLKGRTVFTVPVDARARGGEIDIAADQILVSAVQAVQPGVLTVAPADLNATGAALVILGGVRSGIDIGVAARTVEVDNAGAPLQLNDLVLVARATLDFKDGSAITAKGTGAAEALHVSGDGALVRVSSDPLATTQRSDAVRSQGDLRIGANVQLGGGAVTVEATQSNTLADSVTIAASSLTIGGNRIAVGLADASLAAPGTTVLTPVLAASVGHADSLTLRSFDGIDVYGATTLGGNALHSLTLDAGTVRVQGADAAPRIEAGEVRLTNTSGSASTSAVGTATLAIVANGNGSDSGRVVVGPGQVAVSGVSSVLIDAAHEALFSGQTGLATAGDLRISATALQGTQAAQAQITARGRFTLDSGGKQGVAEGGLGAHLAVDAASIEQGGRIDLPSGELVLTAVGPPAAPGAPTIHFAPASMTDVSGRSKVFDGVTVATPGGDVAMAAVGGGVAVDAGALIDASAPATGARAGSIAISAPQGSVDLSGMVRASSAIAQGGGTLQVDSGMALDLGRLARTVAAGQGAQTGNFAAAIRIRNRTGDQMLAAGTRIAAQDIEIESDRGALTISGILDASGAATPRIELAAGGNLTVAPGAALVAHGTGAAGADLRLSSSGAQVTLAAGATIDSTGTGGGPDGVLLVRAPITGISVAQSGGTGVAVAPIAATLAGVGAVEVEAVHAYESPIVDASLLARINADNTAFAGAGGSNAQSIRSTLAKGDAGLLARLELRAGVEVDSSGDLMMIGNPATFGWNLTGFAANGSPLAQPTGAPMNLTLRAAGNLTVAGSISDGFMPAGALPTTAAAAARITPTAVIVGEGGRIRLVGGADLSAADPIATIRSSATGDVTIGSQDAAGNPANTIVRSTTGSIDIAAGRDVTLLNRSAAVYTTGLPESLAKLNGYIGNRLSASAYLLSGASTQTPFLDGGGSIAIDAGRDLVGAGDSPPQYGSDWLWRNRDLSTTTGQALWWGRYDRFRQGVATFGGGSVSAEAGRDAVDVEISAASSGYTARNADGTVGGPSAFGGGDTSLVAGRDVIGGFMLSGRGAERVSAGRDIAAAPDVPGLQVLYGDSQVDVSARNQLDLGAVASFGMVTATRQFTSRPVDQYLGGVAPNASLVVESSAGNLNYRATPTTSAGVDLAEPHAAAGSSSVQDRIVPDNTSFVAFAGDAQLGQVVQVPAGTSSLQILAQGNVASGGITVTGTQPKSQTPQIVSGGPVISSFTVAFSPGLDPIDLGQRSPVRIVALDGDASLSATSIVKPIRVIAGRDVVLVCCNSPAMELQHQTGDELSLVEAGRDIVFPNSQLVGLQDLKLHGPGDLVLAAGRNILLSTSGGIGSIGNRENAALADVGARITVLTGLMLGSGDYGQAGAWFFPLLGGKGIAGYAPDLYAQLLAAEASQPLPGLGSPAALDFRGATIDQQIERTKTAAGSSVFDSSMLTFVQRHEGDATLTLDKARTVFDTLGSADKASVVGAALATAWTSKLTQAQQTEQALAMASTQGSDHSNATALVAFVQEQTGRSGLSPAEALQAFAALAPERQWIFTSHVLFEQVRSAGRAATALTGADREAAYQKAYDAIDVVFPAAGSNGDLNMGSSQVSSLQGAEILMLSPRGGINVGELASGPNPKPSNELGIVTAAGGDISLLVRDNVLVNQSRVFTVGKGDLLMWASDGNLDAGRGAKTVTGAPPPVFRLDSQGNFVIDTSGSFTGSGIAVLDASSTLDLYAPKGEINAGDAGIKSLGNAFFGASHFVGADNLSIGGVAVGAPPPASTGGATAGLAGVGQAANTASTRINPDDSEEEKERKRKKRLNLILDFLGFGDGSAKP